MSKPQVILLPLCECTCGCDRTGEFKYLNQTWTVAMAYDIKLIDRNHMSQWYCAYLAANGQYSHSDCGNCKPFRCS
jgi:hypothetical protein